jgi:chorismate mutase
MEGFMTLLDYRAALSAVDEDLIDLLQKRMEITLNIALYKKEHGLPVYDPEREAFIISNLMEKMPLDFKYVIAPLYEVIFELSREYQKKVMNGEYA